VEFDPLLIIAPKDAYMPLSRYKSGASTHQLHVFFTLQDHSRMVNGLTVGVSEPANPDLL
jgi:hypothetical protein